MLYIIEEMKSRRATGEYLMTKRNKILRIMMHVAVAIYGVACLWLYYQQSVTVLPEEGLVAYQSDLPLHISMIVEDGWYYSFTAYAYKVLHVLFGGSTFGIALLLAACSVATVYVTERVVYAAGYERKAVTGSKADDSGMEKGDKAAESRCGFVVGNRELSYGWHTLLLALSLNLVMPIFIEFIGPYRYISYQSANIWHNSTYVCMKLFALMTFLYYLKLEQKYRDGISVKEWIAFALLNVITTGIKPSFLLAFSPIMGIFLLVDLFKKVPFKRIFIFGAAMLPSGLVVLWQNAVLFGEDTGNGMSFNPWYTFSLHANIPKAAAVLSVAFCGAAVLATFKEVWKQRQYLFVMLMAILGFLEALCLVESGRRSADGNFLWGYSFCLFVFFIFTAVKAFRYPRKTWLQKGIFTGLMLLYFWHLYCGVEYFIRLVCGESYWMMR